MAALPYMQLYVAEYLADTAHLTAAQHGGYLLLLMNYWQRGKPLRNENERLAIVARMSNEEWARNRDAIAEFFEVTDGEWIHHRVERDLEAVLSKSEKARAAGKASAEHRHSERSSARRNGRSTNAKHALNHTDVDTDTEADKKQGSSAPSAPPAKAKAPLPPIADEERPPLALARHLLLECALPQAPANTRSVAAAIEAYAQEYKITELHAAAVGLAAHVKNAQDRGESITKFWFEDAKWRRTAGPPKGPVDVRTQTSELDEVCGRVHSEYGFQCGYDPDLMVDAAAKAGLFAEMTVSKSEVLARLRDNHEVRKRIEAKAVTTRRPQ